MNEPTAAVYRCYDDQDLLLYVGVSSSLKARLRNHRYTSPWFGRVARVTATHDMPWSVALDLEHEAISSEAPLHNRPSRRRPLPPIESETEAAS